MIYEGFTIWIWPSNVYVWLSNRLNRRMCKEDKSIPKIVSMYDGKPKIAQKFTILMGACKSFFELYATDPAVAESDATNFRYYQSAKTAPLQNVKDVVAKSGTVASMYNEKAVNDVSTGNFSNKNLEKVTIRQP